MSLQRETVRRVASAQEQLDNLVAPEQPDDLISPFLALPGLRAFYPMSAVGTAGQARDLGGSGATYDLTNNNSADFGYDQLAPYCNYDGTNQYHSFIDNANFDILGNEAYIEAAYQGLTIGGWFQFDDDPPGADEWLIAKMAGAPNRSYLLQRLVATTIRFIVNNTIVIITSTATTASGAWYFLWGRYNPGAVQQSVGVNEAIVTGASLAAPITNSGADFTIAASGVPGNYMDGRASLVFVCAEQLSDAILSSLFQQTRGAFGV